MLRSSGLRTLIRTAIFLPVIVISGVFYDADNAPAFLRDIARALPAGGLLVVGAFFIDLPNALIITLFANLIG